MILLMSETEENYPTPSVPYDVDVIRLDPYAADENAPYGYMDDPVTGERRPKKNRGRQATRPREPGVTPTLQDLKSEKRGESDVKDRAPERPKKTRGQGPAPAYKAGVITKGMNGLYRKTGKIMRVFDGEVGQAFIDISVNDAGPGEDDDSVGAAWDELARTNPRVRATLMKLVKGGAVGALLYAHLPIAMVIVMKPAVRDRIPFGRLIDSLAETDSDSPSDLPGGMTGGDVADMGAMLQSQLASMGINPDELMNMAQGMGLTSPRFNDGTQRG
jgi:hypothetical protein